MPCRLIFVMVGVFLELASCKHKASESGSQDFENKVGANDDSAGLAYKYMGPLPEFSDVSITVSYGGRTVRVDGIPQGLSEEELKVRTRDGQDLDYLYPGAQKGHWYVVYPIAVGKRLGTFEGAREGKFVRVYPRRPWQPQVLDENGNEKYAAHSWELMPYLGYAGTQENPGGIALHTPHTKFKYKDKSMLHLLRGPVSMGCKRMAPEHILELSHILGIDLHKAISSVYISGAQELAAINAHGAPGNFIKSIVGIDTVKLKDGTVAQVDVAYPFTNDLPGFGKTVMVHKTWNLANPNRGNAICYYKYNRSESADAAACRYYDQSEIVDPSLVRTDLGKVVFKTTAQNAVGLYKNGKLIRTPEPAHPVQVEMEADDPSLANSEMN